MRKETVQNGQTIYDLAVQHYGDAGAVFLLCADNPGLVSNWHDHPVPGTVIYIKSAAVNSQVVDYYKRKNTYPVSITAPDPEDLPGGALLLTDGGNYLVTNNNQPIIAQ